MFWPQTPWHSSLAEQANLISSYNEIIKLFQVDHGPKQFQLIRCNKITQSSWICGWKQATEQLFLGETVHQLLFRETVHVQKKKKLNHLWAAAFSSSLSGTVTKSISPGERGRVRVDGWSQAAIRQILKQISKNAVLMWWSLTTVTGCETPAITFYFSIYFSIWRK